jgi:NAD(P)-dependent dehydrogenase (short-subunit alcohol dehydrogenase family)
MSRFLIVGGSRGIGAALARRLDKAGHDVIVMSRVATDLPAHFTHLATDVLSDEGLARQTSSPPRPPSYSARRLHGSPDRCSG